MSTGNLQEMGAEATQQAKSAVNATAQPGDPMVDSGAVAATPGQTIVDLGGPTPYNYRSTDGSAALKTGAVKPVSDVVTKSAARAEEIEVEDEVIEEEEVVAEEEVVVEEPTLEINVDEDVEALFGDEDLSEEFKERAKTVFEAAFKSKLQEAADIIAANYEKALEENVAAIHQELTERVDSYLEYVSGEWLAENALQVERGLKSELSESFMTGLKSLFEEHYVEIPEEKYNVLESMVDKLDEMESKLNEQIERNVQLTHRLSESVSDSIFHGVARGLSETQKEKLASLSESVEFVSEEDYREKLEVLRGSYFSRTPSTQTRVAEEEMFGSEAPSTISESMNAYIAAVQKYSNK